jgi:glycosyltransferase involved in cell wall biosynthesis
MKIAIDAHSVGTQLAGNATYAASMIEALAAVDKENKYTLYVTLPEAADKFRDRWPNITVSRIMPHAPLVRIPLSLSWELRRRPVDILFVQFTAPPFAPCNVVTAVHDLSFEHLPDTFKRRSVVQMKLTIRNTAKNAAHVIACSEYSRQDIIETYKLPPEKVSAVLLAASEHIKQASNVEVMRVREKYDLPGEFILGVGSIQPRKNLARLIEAYAQLASQHADLPPLILVGKKAWLSDSSVDAAIQFGVADKVRFTGFVPDEDLAAIYSAAKLFVYPSYFEGFGIPPLEAMQCGVPVIAGNKTSLPEVVGDAGILVDPFDTDAIADAIFRVLDDSELQDDLKEKGFDRAKLFSWEKAARETLDIFERIHAD